MGKQAKGRRGLRALVAWAAELAALAAAVAIVAAIAVMLVRYDGQKVPEWQWSVGLNAVVALLTLGMRAALALVATEVISQAKWMWFARGPQRLAYFQLLDEASRGFLGSVKLVGLARVGFRGSPVVVVAAAAAVTSVLSLAIGPFTQQAIRTVPCLRPAPEYEARVPVAVALPGSDGSFTFPYDISKRPVLPGVGPRAQGTIVSAIANPGGGGGGIVRPLCPTGNCTFPETLGVPHSTIALCARCLDTTPLLRQAPNRSVIWLGSGNGNDSRHGQVALSADGWKKLVAGPGGGGFPNLSFAEPVMTAEFRATVELALATFSVLTWTRARDARCDNNRLEPFDSPSCFVAATCSYYACTKDIQVRVADGQLQETMTNPVAAQSNFTLEALREGYTNLFVVKSPCLVDGQVYDASNFSRIPGDGRTRLMAVSTADRHGMVRAPSECVYSVSGSYAAGLGLLLSQVFSGHCDSVPMASEKRGYVFCDEHWWLQQLYHRGNASFRSLDGMVQGVAAAVTDFFRVDGWGPIDDRGNNPAEGGPDREHARAHLRGEAHRSTVCIRLDWAWLLPAGAICLTTAALLVAMLAMNATGGRGGAPVWKSSALPLLFSGLALGRRPDEADDELDSLRRRAESAVASLRRDGGSARSVLVVVEEPEAEQTSASPRHEAGGTPRR
ncbi:hypothetical protein CDD83_1901 [Cordyceps sp. RAO-2017]|nr:hypothetical protein CDD83_1901 [Cordyceps sp. RAO-2017]